MELFIIVIALILILWAAKARKKDDIPESSAKGNNDVEIVVEVSKEKLSSIRPKRKGRVKEGKDGGWIINPTGSFKLTLLDCPKDIAEEIRGSLDENEYQGIYNAEKSIEQLVATHKVKCKEIEDYISKYGQEYEESIQKQMDESEEWKNASEKDREDMLVEFKKNAIEGLYVKPYNEFEILFEYNIADANEMVSLIEKYGYTNLYFYSRFINSLGKVRIVPATHRDRERYEKLVEVGLAVRGKDIPIDSVLDTLKLKELNELADEDFKRKKEAIEHLKAQSDILDRVGKIIAFRELFKLAELDLEQDVQSDMQFYFRYVKVVSELIAHTYSFSLTASEERKDYLQDRDFFKGWIIHSAGDDSCCPMCREASSKKYPKDKPPKLPFHIGCRCSLGIITKYD